MAISGGDLTNMRAGNQVVKPHLNVTPKVVIATMLINQSSYQWPLAQVTVDNVSMNGGIAFADIPIGSLVYIGTTAGAHDVTTSVIRKAPSGTTLFLSACGPGDPGYALFENIMFANDYYITVLAVKPLWSLLSRISGSTFYKRYDIPYVDEGDDPAPVCNIGPWKRLALTGATVSQAFTNAAITDVKPASFAWGSKTLSSYAWTTRNSDYDENTGASFDGGTDNTAGVTIDFDTAGFYIVYCTLTDSGGKTHTAETYVWVVDGTNESDLSGWYVEQDKQDREGRQITFGRFGDTAESVVYPGAGFLYTEEHAFNGATVTAGATVTTFAGYVRSDKPERQIMHGKTLFEVVGPARLLKDIPNASQYIIEDATPTKWTEATSDLTHPSGMAWYILQHHCPAMLQVFDYAPLIDDAGDMDTTYRDHTWLFSGKSIWAQIKEIMPHQINAGCDSQGALYLRHDPQLMSAADRAALDERMTWGAGDIRDSLKYTQITRLPVGIVDGYAFSYNGTNITPYWARSPGDTQAQGKTNNTVNGLIVPTTTAQVRLNAITGHLFAKANSPTPQIVIQAMRNFDTADPARMVWHKLNVASTYDPRGVGWSNMLMAPLKVSRKWQQQESGAWIKRIDITMQPETSGNSALTKQIPISSADDWDQWGDWFDPFAWGDIITDDLIFNPALNAGLTTMAAVNTDGYLYTTTDYETTEAMGGPTWARTNLSMSGTPVQFVVDAFSPGYTGEGTVINGWIATTTNIYRITDIFGAVGAASQHIFANAASGINMDFSFGTSGWGVCVYNSLSNGVYCTYTTDSGSTWTVDAAITAFSNSSNPHGGVMTPGLYVSPRTAGKVYAGAWQSSGAIGTAQGDLYQSDDYGATWAASTDFTVSVLNDGIGFEFHIPYARVDEDIIWYSLSGWSFAKMPVDLWHSTTSGTAYLKLGNSAVQGRWSIVSSPQDANYMAMFSKSFAGTGDGTNDGWLTVSTDAGENWSYIKNYGILTYHRVAIAGNDKQTLFVFGTGVMEYSNNFGATLDSRYGNLASFVPGQFIGIAGG